MNTALQVRFWGVRGSVPAPGGSTVEYGGNTSCLEVRAAGQVVILDAGTGIRLLGKALKAEGALKGAEVTLLLTHTHWDHIQGLPFFITLLEPDSRLRILGCEGAREGLATLLARQMESPFFPVPLLGSAATIHIEELNESELAIGRINVRSLRANHPGTCVGYRLDLDGKAVAFFPDNEPPMARFRLPEFSKTDALVRRAQQSHTAMVDFVRGVDLLVMDAQYDAEEYASHVGWGHGCVDDVVRFATEAEVKRLVLFHHDPDHDDRKVSEMALAGARLARQAGATLQVEAAREGSSIPISLDSQNV